MVSIGKMDNVTEEWTNTSLGKIKALEEPVSLLHSPLISHRMTFNWTRKDTCDDVWWHKFHVKFNDHMPMIEMFLEDKQQIRDSYWSQHFQLNSEIMKK